MPATQSDPDFLILLSVSVGILLLFITTIVSLVFLSQRRYLLHQQQIQKMQQSYDQELLKAHIEVQEQTFMHISEEIHDNIGQSLSLVKLNLNMGQETQIEQAKDILTLAIRELRELAQSLNSDALKRKGLVSFISDEIDRLKQTQAYQVDFFKYTDEEDLCYDNQILLVRIFQEAINNVIKHASATRVEVTLSINQRNLRLQIGDNGNGFDRDTTTAGIGLLNMQKRAILAGGTLKITSRQSKGCMLVLETNLNKPIFDGHGNHNSSFS